MIKTELRDRTLELLLNRPSSLSLADVAQATTLDLNWLKLFAKGQTKHPSVCRIQTLYEYLSNNKLTI